MDEPRAGDERKRLRFWRRPMVAFCPVGIVVWTPCEYREGYVLDVRLGRWRFCAGWKSDS